MTKRTQYEHACLLPTLTSLVKTIVRPDKVKDDKFRASADSIECCVVTRGWPIVYIKKLDFTAYQLGKRI